MQLGRLFSGDLLGEISFYMCVIGSLTLSNQMRQNYNGEIDSGQE
jgi:hypothetical protein